MAEETNSKPKSEIGTDGQDVMVEAQIIGQFIKDLSFENPSVDRRIDAAGDPPNIKLEINVAAKKLKQDDLFESVIDFKAVAANKDGTIYDLEVLYVGLFRIKNLPEQALEPFLLINCPTLTFPFLRRLVADITREGGFPPLLLDPIDFGQLFMRRKQEMAAAANSKPN